MEYGGNLYATASKTLWSRIKKLQSHGLRLITGAFPSSPIPALLLECGMPLILVRCKHLADKFILRKLACTRNPLIDKLKLLLQHYHIPTLHWTTHKINLLALSYQELQIWGEKIRRDPIYLCYKNPLEVTTLKKNNIPTNSKK
jgi:hypothetical protein